MVSTIIKLKNKKRTGLLVGGPKSVCDLLGHGAAANGNSLAVRSDLDSVQLVEIDLNAMVHSAQSGDGSVSCVVGEERQVLGVGELDLQN